MCYYHKYKNNKEFFGGKILRYATLSNRIMNEIIKDTKTPKLITYKCLDEDALRRDMTKDNGTLWRPSYVRDVEKILHLPLYNRYSDKTQVFSFYHNDDITRRALHVQLVSRIARNIGKILGLNLDLIEAIALGHDIGHTPFGHAGEDFLNELYHNETGRFFYHNVQSVRVLDKIFQRNITLQTLDGILSHNGAFESGNYIPKILKGFEDFDKKIEKSYILGKEYISSLKPATLEGCVVRLSDMIAYLGKDRQDAEKAHIINDSTIFSRGEIGDNNSEMINNISVNIIENSYGKEYIKLSDKLYEDLKTAKMENNLFIYKNPVVKAKYEESVQPMFKELYYKLLHQIKNKESNSIIFDHHINFVNKIRKISRTDDYLKEEPNQIVVDFLSSMTDDYFIKLHDFLFPNSKYKVNYISYFEKFK